MPHFVARFAMVIILSLCFGSTVTAQDRREANLIKSMGLAPGARVTYQDDAGKPLGFDGFFKLVVAGRTVAVSKDTKANTATVSIEAVGKPQAPVKSLKVSAGDPLPPLRLNDAKGTHVSNAALKGRYTLINFLYSECGPCIAEIPVLNSFARSHPELRTFAVTFDTAKDARLFAARRKFDWPLFGGAQAFIAAVGVTVYPTMVLVGPDGRVLGISTSSQIAGAGKQVTASTLSAWVSGLVDANARN